VSIIIRKGEQTSDMKMWWVDQFDQGERCSIPETPFYQLLLNRPLELLTSGSETAIAKSASNHENHDLSADF
jgi:hypothetical protein